jgi:hypothetical protein
MTLAPNVLRGRGRARCLRPEDCAEPTTPSAPLKGGFAASFLMSRPPLLFKEGKTGFHYNRRFADI